MPQNEPRITLAKVRKEHRESMRQRKDDIVHAYNVLRDLEQKWGHTGVMCSLRLWFNRPKRGKFL